MAVTMLVYCLRNYPKKMKLIKYLSNILKRKKSQINNSDKEFSKQLEAIIGYTPLQLDYFKEAFTLKSQNTKNNFERLEFLGDSVLGSFITNYLFHQFPNKDEGYLTQMKSKIVNRQNLNSLGENLGLKKLIVQSLKQSLSADITGNLLEALIGAIFLDIGYSACEKIVMNRIFSKVEMLKLENKIISYKGYLMQICQQQKINLQIHSLQEDRPNQNNVYFTKVYIDEHLIANACDISKKKSEEKACRRSYYYLLKSERIQFEKNY